MTATTPAPDAPTPLLEVEHLQMYFPIRGGNKQTKGFIQAVDDNTA